MSAAGDRPDDLQKLWQGGVERSGKEDYSMVLRLAQEKQRSLLDLLREQNMTAYLFSLCFAPLTAMAAWKGRGSIWLLSGYALMTVTLLAGAVVVWLMARKARAVGKNDLSTREHQRQLIAFYDRRVRFSKSIKYWYAMSLFLGAGLVGYPIGVHFLSRVWGIVLVVGFLLICWIGVWHMHDVRGVDDLRRRRQEVLQVLSEMDRE